MARHTRTVLTAGHGGWVRYEASGVAGPVFLRFEDRGGRLAPVDLFLPSDSGLSSDLLRRVSLREAEARVNEADFAEGVRAKMQLPSPDLRTAVAFFASGPAGDTRDWVQHMFTSQYDAFEGRRPSPPPLASAIDDEGSSGPSRPRSRLRLPPAERGERGDAFYQSIAEHYTHFAVTTRAPARAIAEKLHVDPATVRGWVREARNRGFLPPASSGKAG